MMMVVPKDAYVDEGQRVDAKERRHGLDGAPGGLLGQADFQHHDGDDDRDHAVGERIEAVRLHSAGESLIGQLFEALVRH